MERGVSAQRHFREVANLHGNPRREARRRRRLATVFHDLLDPRFVLFEKRSPLLWVLLSPRFGLPLHVFDFALEPVDARDAHRERALREVRQKVSVLCIERVLVRLQRRQLVLHILHTRRVGREL